MILLEFIHSFCAISSFFNTEMYRSICISMHLGRDGSMCAEWGINVLQRTGLQSKAPEAAAMA